MEPGRKEELGKKHNDTGLRTCEGGGLARILRWVTERLWISASSLVCLAAILSSNLLIAVRRVVCLGEGAFLALEACRDKIM